MKEESGTALIKGVKVLSTHKQNYNLPGDVIITKKYRIVHNFSRISALKAAKYIFLFITAKFPGKEVSILHSMLRGECLAPLGAQGSPTLQDCQVRLLFSPA